MAYCAIRRGEDGSPDRVVTANGNASVLFDRIAGIPHVESVDRAVEIYKNVLSDRFVEKFGRWYDDGTATSRKTDMVGRSLTEAEARRAVEAMEAHAVDVPSLNLTPGNWIAEFGKDGMVETPVGQVAMGENQYQKLVSMRRENQFGMVKPTLTNPDMILEAMSEANEGETSRKTSYLFIRTFNVNGEKIKHFESVTVRRDKKEAVVSSHILRKNQLLDRMKTGSVVYMATSLNASGQASLEYTSPSGTGVSSSTGKDTEKSGNRQRNPLKYANGEPRLFFRTQSGVTDSYAEALRQSRTGTIEAGFIGSEDYVEAESADMLDVPGNEVVYCGDRVTLNRPDRFITVLRISADCNPATRGGLVNYLVANGYLSGEKMKVNGAYVLTGAGAQNGVRMLNSRLAYTKMANRLGRGYVTYDGRLGTVRFTDKLPRGTFRMIRKAGGTKDVKIDEIRKALLEGRYEALAREYEYLDAVVATIYVQTYNHERPVYDYGRQESTLKVAMLDILESLGVSVTSISDYLEKYRLKHGTDVPSHGLADMANRIVALASGEDTATLTEETAHFVVETFGDQQAIDAVLPDVASTEEYKANAETYRAIYRKQYGDEAEVERMVRREVLGKLLAREYASRMEATPRTLWQKIRELINRYIRGIRSAYTGQSERLREVVRQLADLSLAQEMSRFDSGQLVNRDFVMFNAQQAQRDLNHAKYLEGLDAAYAMQNRQKIETGAMKAQRDRAAEKFVEGEILNGLSMFITATDGQANSLMRQMKRAKKEQSADPSKGWWALTSQVQLDSVKHTLLPLLIELRAEIHNGGYGGMAEERAALLKRIDAVNGKMNETESEVRRLNGMDSAGLIDRFCDRYGVPERSRSWIHKYTDGTVKDCMAITRWFGALEHSSNPVLGMLMNIISEANTKATIDARTTMQPLFKLMDEKGTGNREFMQIITKDEKGNATGYLLNERDFAKYHQARRDAQLLALQGAVRDARGNLKYAGLSLEELRRQGRQADFAKGALRTTSGEINRISLTEDEYRDAKAYMDRWDGENDEKPYTEEYYARLEQSYREMAELREDFFVYDDFGKEIYSIRRGEAISEEARRAVRNLAGRRIAALNRYRDGKGRVDWDRLQDDEATVAALNQIAHDRSELKSEYDAATGERKTGMDLRIAKDIQAMDNYDMEVAERIKARHSLADVSRLERKGNRFLVTLRNGQQYSIDMPQGKIQEEFFAKVREIQFSRGKQAAYGFVRRNGRLTFGEAFWERTLGVNSGDGRDGRGDGGGFRGMIEDALEGEDVSFDDAERGRIMRLLDRIEEVRRKRSEVLRSHREFDNPAETDYDSMSTDARGAVRRYTEELEDLREDVMSILGSQGIRLDFSEFAENEANGAYYAALQDDDTVAGEKDFIDGHLTGKGQARYRHFRGQMERKTYVFESREMRFLERFFSNTSYRLPDGTPDTARELDEYYAKHGHFDGLIIEYGKTMLLPYFKRFAPAGYDALLQDMREGRVDMDVMMSELRLPPGQRSERYRMVELQTQSDWYEDDGRMDRYRNPDCDRSGESGIHQPKLSKYRNEEFFRTFAPEKDADGRWQATRNRSLWDLREMFKGLKRQALANYNEQDRAFHNLYQLPQISKTMTQKVLGVPGERRSFKQSAGNVLADLFTTRIDDPLYGQGRDLRSVETTGDERLLIMPKYYLGELESVSDVSTDLAYAYSMLIYQSAKYGANMDSIGEVRGLEQELRDQTFRGRAATDTNMYKMFRDWVNFHFYGKRMSKKATFNVLGHEVDVSKAIHLFTRLSGVMNLGFSPVIALTSAATMASNIALERVVGQYIDRDSFGRAMRETKNMAPDFFSEYGSRHKTKRLNVLGEHFGIYSFMERVSNAGYKKLFRGMQRGLNPFGLMELANSPYAPHVMVSVLMGYRLVNGRFVNYKQFEQRTEFAGRPSKEIRAEWEKLKEWSLWDCMQVEDGLVKYADRFTDRSNGGTDRPAIDAAVHRATREIRVLNEKCDGTIAAEDKSTIGRSYFTAGVMMHRGWLTQALARRWRPRGYNFSTNQEEEGSYRALLRFFGDAFRGMEERSMRGFMKALKENWGDMDATDRQNGRRLLFDIAFFAAFTAIAFAMKGLSDDDDNEDSWMVQLMAYVGLRTVNEMNSQVLEPLLFKNVVEAVKSPWVPMRQLQEFTTWKNYSSKEVPGGHYRGHTRLYRLLMDNNWAKNYYRLQSSADIRSSIRGWKEFSADYVWI
jgi:hypothetical protein